MGEKCNFLGGQIQGFIMLKQVFGGATALAAETKLTSTNT